jgi:uncharacterized protein YsxB (DUF464 family)
LFRDLARLQGEAQQKPSPVKEPPTIKSYGLSDVTPYIPPIVCAAVSLLMFSMGMLYTVEARRMTETPENQERRT